MTIASPPRLSSMLGNDPVGDKRPVVMLAPGQKMASQRPQAFNAEAQKAHRVASIDISH